jgi:cell division protein FtsB
MINYLALMVALTVSAVSGYYSIIGLTTIFASAYYPVIIMGTALELGKLVSASWLYRNWKSCPFLLKTYLTLAVMILMLISSMGIFGFLSRAHIEQSLNINTGQSDQIQILELKINTLKQSNDDLDKQVKQIDDAIGKLTERGQAQTSLKAAEQQRKTRDSLIKRKEENVKNLSELQSQKVSLQSGIKKLEAEVGPLKYIAELVYSSADINTLERAVRMVIILIVLVFDPLAVVLLIAANHGLRQTKQYTLPEKYDILKIDNEVLGENR